MLVTELPHSLVVTTGVGRSEGLHVSNIIRAAGLRSGAIRPFGGESITGIIPPDTGRDFDDDATLRIVMGLAWEAELLLRLPHLMGHPGEYSAEGIIMSPDALSWEPLVTGGDHWNGRFRVHEIKLTYKSARNGPSDLWAYMSQLKAYCKAVGTTAAALHVLFVCGDYMRPITPLYKVWQIEFTQLEIDENFSMLRNFAVEQGKL